MTSRLKTIFKYIQKETPTPDPNALWLDENHNVARYWTSGGTRAEFTGWKKFQYGYSYGYLYSYTTTVIYFPFDSGIFKKYSVGNFRAGAGCNSSEHGYITSYSYISKFSFPFHGGYLDNCSADIPGIIQNTSNNSSSHGYICGGDPYHYATSIHKFSFPFNSGDPVSQYFSLNRSREDPCSNNSSSHGFVIAGDDYLSYNNMESFSFPFEGESLTEYSLDHSKHRSCANNSSHHGYIYGGLSYPRTHNIIKFIFAFADTQLSIDDALNHTRHESTANNSSTHGYVYSGDGPTSRSTAERILFPFNEGIAELVSQLENQVNQSDIGMDETDFVHQFI